MSDPISTVAGAVTIIDRAARAIHWLMRSLGRKQPLSHTSKGPYAFELRPLSFTVELLQTVPFVELSYYAVNYLNRPLTLADAKVTLRLAGGPPIEHVPLVQDFRVAPRSSFMVFFRRNLLDSEARVLSLLDIALPAHGSFALTAKAKCGRREHTYGPIGSLRIQGWVNKPASA